MQSRLTALFTSQMIHLICTSYMLIIFHCKYYKEGIFKTEKRPVIFRSIGLTLCNTFCSPYVPRFQGHVTNEKGRTVMFGICVLDMIV